MSNGSPTQRLNDLENEVKAIAIAFHALCAALGKVILTPTEIQQVLQQANSQVSSSEQIVQTRATQIVQSAVNQM